MSATITPTKNLFDIREHLLQLEESELGVLALDFDHVLGISPMKVASDHFNEWSMRVNVQRGLYSEAHADLLGMMRQNTLFNCCEHPEQVNKMIEDAKAKGWKVVVLTARHPNSNPLTQRNIKAMGLNDIPILNSKSHKGVRLVQFFETLPEWPKTRKVRVIFADDKDSHCRKMATLASLIPTKSVDVKVFHYTKHLVSEHLTEKDLKILATQLFAFQRGEQIPHDHEVEKHIPRALRELNLTAVNDHSLHRVIRDIASEKGVPLATCTKSVKRSKDIAKKCCNANSAVERYANAKTAAKLAKAAAVVIAATVAYFNLV